MIRFRVSHASKNGISEQGRKVKSCYVSNRGLGCRRLTFGSMTMSEQMTWSEPIQFKIYLLSIFFQRIFTSPTIMVSAQRNTKSPQIFQEDVSSSDSDEDYHSAEDSRSVMTGGNKSRTSRTTTSKQKGKQPQKRRYAGKLSKLLDMPLDVLYEVSHRTDSFTEDGIDNPALHRYSLSFARRTYCGCRGPARPFVMFSRTSLQDKFG